MPRTVWSGARKSMDEPSGIGRADGDDLGLLNDSVPEEET